MKITILSPYLKLAGGVIILVNYAHYLNLLGHKVEIVVISKTRWRRALANLLCFKPSWTRNFKIKIKRIPEIKEEFMPQADILFFSSSAHAEKIKNFNKSKGKKVYLIQHDERMYHEKSEIVSKTYKLPYKFITVATWLKEMLKNEFQQEADVLLNPIDRNIFYPRPRKKNKEIRILMLHHIYKWKGTEEGMKIVQELKEKYRNIKLVMYGARKENVQCDEYHYNIFGNKLGELQASCDIFLCPSWDEGFGLPSLEAMASKTVLVTYDNGGSRDFAFDYKTAMVAQRKNKKELKEKLEILIKDEKLRQKIINQAYDFFLKMPTWKQQAKKLEIIFNNVLKK